MPAAAKPDPRDPNVIAWMTRHEADMAFRKRVQTIFEWIQPTDDMLILDMPCGRGFYLNMFRYVSDCTLVGAELDWDVLLKAQRNVGHLPDVALHNTNIYALPYASNSFDAVILSEILEHVDDDVAALKEIYRVLKPGGVVAITVPNADYPFLWDPINKSLEMLTGRHIQHGPFAGIWANHVRLYWRDDLRNAVLNGGFLVEEERSFTHACMPFIHNVVYGFGKPVLESGLLGSAGKAADRTAFDHEPGRFNPISLGIGVLNWFDRPNQINEPPHVSTVNLALKARKPGVRGPAGFPKGSVRARKPKKRVVNDAPFTEFEEQALLSVAGRWVRHPASTTRDMTAVLRGRPPAPASVALATAPVSAASVGLTSSAIIETQKVDTGPLDRRVTLARLLAYALALLGAWLMAAMGNEFPTGLIAGMPLLVAGAAIWAGADIVRLRRASERPRFLRFLPEQGGWISPEYRMWTARALIPRVILLALAFVFAWAGVVGSQGNHFTITGIVGWVLSVLIAIWAIAPDGWTPLTALQGAWDGLCRWRPRLTSVGAALLIIMGVALLLRVQDLPLAPREMTSDHVEMLLDTYRLLEHGDTSVFFAGNGGREALQFYTLALFSQLPGQSLSFDSLKLLNVLQGVLTLPVLYWMTITVLGPERRRLAVVAGLCVASLVAVSYWHITLSRLGERIVLTPLVVSLFILTFTRALRGNRLWDYILTGVVLGVGLYTYQVIRLLPVVVIAGAAIALIFHWRHGRGTRRLVLNTIVLAFVAFMIFLPLFAYSLEYPQDFWRRTSGRLFGDDITQTTDGQGNLISRDATLGDRLSAFGENVPQLTTNFVNALLMYHWKGDVAWFQSASLKPAFDPFSGALLVLGLGAWLALTLKWRDPALWLLPPAALILMFASAFSIAFPNENPSATRMSGTLPVVYLFAGLAFAGLILGVRRLVGGRAGVVVASAGAGLLLLGSGVTNVNTYWRDYAPLFANSSQAHSEGGAVLREFAQSGSDFGNAFVIGYPFWWDHRAVGIEAGRLDFPNGVPAREELPSWLENGLAREDAYRLDPSRDLLFLVSPDDVETLDWLKLLFPAAVSAEVQTYQAEERFVVVRVPAPGLDGLAAAIDQARAGPPQG
jgi:SAM-dependent methyltransferase